MPTAREAIINRRLSGDEARQLIAADVERLLAAEGLLSSHVAYGRIAWEVELRLHVENALSPDSRSFVESKVNAATPAVSAPPLAAPAPDAVIAGLTISRSIESPNAERLRTGLPITLDVKQQDGTVSQQQVSYPVDPTLEGASEAVITDTFEAARAGWRARMEARVAASDSVDGE